MKAPKLSIIILAAIMFAGCSKNKVTPVNALEGTYKGSFTLTNNDPAANTVPLSGTVSLVLTKPAYTATSPFTLFAASAAGKFVVNNENQITFADSTVHPANFDWTLILTGSYTYSTKGDSLFLNKKIAYNIYTYKLKKQ